VAAALARRYQTHQPNRGALLFLEYDDFRSMMFPIIVSQPRHCEPTDPREVARSDDRLREAIQLCGADWIASSLRSSQ
jgi:hypothetical protein